MTNYQISSREWWVQRWLELLDSYRFKKRLERARKYAKEGNVLSIEFEGGKVLAQVQGSEPEPYHVSLSLDAFSNEDWDYAIETMSQKAVFSAQLLAGEMPANIEEEVFTASGLSLFPFTLSDIHSRCSCPDKANPCKHIGAVYYQLGDRFSEDPFVLFQLRGRTKGEILDTLRQLRSDGYKGEYEEDLIEVVSEQKVKVENSSEDTSLDLEKFWRYEEPLESSLVVIAPPPESKTPIEILGDIPLPSADATLVRQYLDQVYQTVSQQAITSALS
ncbi:MAG: SWIM zinc finger family protein [Spirulinaceae cyanobacterium]